MAGRAALSNAFYEQLFTFLEELKEMYPNDPDFPLGIMTLKMMKTGNPVFVIQTFYDSSKSFEDQILSKDEHFFLDHTFSEFGDAMDFNILSKLKQYVKSMSSTSKDNVWLYVQNLYRIAKAVSSR
jgi:hypothetical protein